jgi:hypothetical protein
VPKLLIHKEGETPTLASPEMTAEECEAQRQRVEEVISIRFREGGVEQARDVAVDLGWCQIGAHVIKGVKVIDAPPAGEVE